MCFKEKISRIEESQILKIQDYIAKGAGFRAVEPIVFSYVSKNHNRLFSEKSCYPFLHLYVHLGTPLPLFWLFVEFALIFIIL